MTTPSERTQAFIIRLWYEAREIEGMPVEWRGMIRHVMSNEQRYFKDLWAVIEFLQSYLEASGVNLTREDSPVIRLHELMIQFQNIFLALPRVEENQGRPRLPSPASPILSVITGGSTVNETEWSVEVKVKDGPRFKQAGKFEVEGYDRVDVSIPTKSSQMVKVQPSGLDDIELFFILRTDKPPAPAPAAGGRGPAATPAETKPPKEVNRTLYYTVADQDTKVELTDLHVVLGQGAINLLCGTPNEICFTNEGDYEATVTILICRRTSAPCPPVTDTGDGGKSKRKDKEQAVIAPVQEQKAYVKESEMQSDAS